MTLRNNLDELKVGDKVIILHGGHSEFKSLDTVEKLHKLHIVTSGGRKWTRNSGYEVNRTKGGYLHYSHLEPYDEVSWNEYVERDNLRSMRVSLGHIVWEKVPDEVVKEVYAVLPKKKKAEEAPNEGTSNSSQGDAVR